MTNFKRWIKLSPVKSNEILANEIFTDKVYSEKLLDLKEHKTFGIFYQHK